MDNAKNRTIAAGPLLVNPGKSSRLQEMRNKAMSANVAQPQNQAVEYDKGLSKELLLARQLIDRRLAEMLASLPVGKQRSLFRIRFGIELDQIKDLPIKRIVNILKISHPALNPLSAGMKRIADLNYNGRQPANPAG